jgi:3'(2'), 5'-bisphosphate nucleotidase
MDRLTLIDQLVPVLDDAARVVETIRARGVVARDKADASPVTEADEAAEALIEAALRRLTPAIPIVGEEAHAADLAPTDLGRHFWLIDPIDGTKEFIRGGPDYTLNVALIEDGAPVLGLVMTPVDGALWAGATGLGAWKRDAQGRHAIHVRQPPSAAIIVVASRNNRDRKTKDFLAHLPEARVIDRSSSVKFCVVAEGSADLYPRYGPTSEWDTAAGHAILSAAGGEVFVPGSRAPLRYGKPGFANGAFVALGNRAGCDALGLLNALEPSA